MLESFLFKIKDHRRKQGQRYQLGHILLFAVLAMLCDADSYRKIYAFIKCHCQQKTVETAVNSNNDVIVQVKENQKMLFNDCLNISATCRPLEIYDEPLDKNRNRIEQRTIHVFESTAVSDKDKGQLVKSVIKVERNRKMFDTKSKCWKSSDEISFYIATTSLSAKQFGDAIRLQLGNRE